MTTIVVKTKMASSTGKPLDRDKFNNQVNGDRINCQLDLPSLPLKDEALICDATTTVDDISGVFLETFIVGHRFNVEKDLNLGARISLSRDSDNATDPNAIKIPCSAKCLVFSLESWLSICLL